LDTYLDSAYKAVIEVTEEAILNSLTMAIEVEGVNGNRVPAIPLEGLEKLMKAYSRVESL